VRTVAVLVAAGLVAGCGGARESQLRSGTELNYHGISIAVPADWDGRVLYSDPTGESAVILQLANFVLSPNDGFSAPPGLSQGEEDPIKAMAGDDLLLMISTDQGAASNRSLPFRISEASFLPRGSPLIPRGHAVAEESGCIEETCLRVTVDFATPPSLPQLRLANDVLASLAIRR
jgi:hypothetical protein